MMTRPNYDHKHCAHQVTQAHIDDAYGAFFGLSQGLSQAFKLLDPNRENCPSQKLNDAEKSHAIRAEISVNSGKLHEAISLTEDVLGEIHSALSGLARLLDEAGYEVQVPAANVAALITPHIRSISMVREMLQGAAR
jgi:hypothetical protein